MRKVATIFKVLLFSGLIFFTKFCYAQGDIDTRIIDLIENEISSGELPSEVLISFFSIDANMDRANYILRNIETLATLDNDAADEINKIQKRIEKYGLRLAEDFSKFWYKEILEDNAINDINLNARIPLFEKDIQKILNSISESCKNTLIGVLDKNIDKFKSYVTRIQKIKSYELELVDIFNKANSDPCNEELVLQLEKIKTKLNEINQVDKEYNDFIFYLILDVKSLVGCYSEIKENYNLQNVTVYKSVMEKQIKEIKYNLEDKLEWSIKNECKETTNLPDSGCRELIDDYRIKYSEIVTDFEKLGLARFKLNSIKANEGRYACASDEFKDIYNSVDVESDNSVMRLENLIHKLDQDLKNKNCNSYLDQLEGLKTENQYKVEFINRDLLDLKELFDDYGIWISENPCVNESVVEEEECPKENMVRDDEGNCVCKKHFTLSPTGECKSMAEILSQSLSDNNDTNDDCMKLGETYSKEFDFARILVEDLSFDATYNGEVVNRFLADPTLRHCCNTGLITSLAILTDTNEEIQNIWLGIANKAQELLNSISSCPDEVYALLDKIRSIEEIATYLEELERLLIEKWESYNCTEDDINAALSRSIEDSRRDALGSKIGGGTREIPCDGIDNDGDGEVDENVDDVVIEEEETADVTLYYGVKLSGHGYRKRWGGIVNEYSGNQIIIFIIHPGESIDQKVAEYELLLIENSDRACQDGPPLCPCAWSPDIWVQGPDLEILEYTTSWSDTYVMYDNNCQDRDNSYPCVNWEVIGVTYDDLPTECR